MKKKLIFLAVALVGFSLLGWYLLAKPEPDEPEEPSAEVTGKPPSPRIDPDAVPQLKAAAAAQRQPWAPGNDSGFVEPVSEDEAVERGYVPAREVVAPPPPRSEPPPRVVEPESPAEALRRASGVAPEGPR